MTYYFRNAMSKKDGLIAWMVGLVVLTALIQGGALMAFSLKTSAFSEGGTIPAKNTCDGDDLSPPLSWSEVPSGTKSLALILDDPDAPPGPWVHWVVYNIPNSSSALEEGLPKRESLSNGTRQGASWGVNDFSRIGYFGPCPPPGKPHRYVFKLFALDQALDLPSKANRFDLERALQGHVLGMSQLVGKYGR